VDQGTSSTRFLVFVAETGQLVTYHQLPIQVNHLHPVKCKYPQTTKKEKVNTSLGLEFSLEDRRLSL
jgi:hypothetical protein